MPPRDRRDPPEAPAAVEDRLMYFDFRAYVELMYRALFRSREANVRMTPKRAAALLLFFLVLFPAFALVTALCLLLDHVLFPGFRRISLDRALFIVGHPRSGTTYLQKVIAQDEGQFFSIRSWEAMCPSILQKKLVSGLGRLDRATGGRLRAAILRREARRQSAHNALHANGLFELAEDDRLLLHAFSAPGIFWLLHPIEPGWQFHFDKLARPRDRERVMRFYRACFQRQAYFKGGGRILLSKTPANALKVRSLREFFPGCRMIYTVRNPLDAVPSLISLGRQFGEGGAGTANWDAQQRWLYEGIREMYRHPLACFPEFDPGTWEIVRYDDLLQRPRETVRRVYEKFGYTVSPAFDERLRREDESQRNYRSTHRPDAARFGLTRERMVEDFREVFERCGFET